MKRPGPCGGALALVEPPPQTATTRMAAQTIAMRKVRCTGKAMSTLPSPPAERICTAGYDDPPVPEDKRQLILDAAVRVFARKGYHTSRVGDIAEEAGVAHGLLYHYLRSKEELLETIFRETWRDVLDAVRWVEKTEETPRERLAGVAKILLRAWRRDPDL